MGSVDLEANRILEEVVRVAMVGDQLRAQSELVAISGDKHVPAAVIVEVVLIEADLGDSDRLAVLHVPGAGHGVRNDGCRIRLEIVVVGHTNVDQEVRIGGGADPAATFLSMVIEAGVFLHDGFVHRFSGLASTMTGVGVVRVGEGDEIYFEGFARKGHTVILQ